MVLAPLLGCLLALAPTGVTQDTRDVGPLHFERRVALQWPGLAMPAFTVVADRRWVHTFSLGFNRGLLRAFSLDVVVVEPSYDTTLRAQSVAAMTHAAKGSIAAQASITLPRNVRLSIGGLGGRRTLPGVGALGAGGLISSGF